MTEVEIAVKAVQIYAEMRPRPSHATQDQAAEMAGVSRGTISKMIMSGRVKLNEFARIPLSEIDRASAA